MYKRNETANGMLDNFTKLCWYVIREKAIAKQLQPMVEPYQHIEIGDFTYDQTGPSYTRSAHETRFRQDWRRAGFDIGNIIFKTETYLSIQTFLVANFPYPHAATLFQQYAFQLFDILLQHAPQVINITAVTDYQNRLLRDLNQEPHSAHATIYLSGLTLQSDEIQIDEHTILRKTRISDLEVKKHQPENFSFIPYPSCVLELRYERKHNDYGIIHESKQKFVKLVRLFQAASITEDYYEIVFETITAPKKVSSGYGGLKNVWQTLYLETSRETHLLSFFQNFRLPANLTVLKKKADYITTANDRYKESLIETVPVERRIANAIMGLESLLSDNNAEITFRLTCRASRILCIMGYEPLEIKRYLVKAYAIRSNYAHGGFIDERERRNIEANFGALDPFALTIVDYLRALFIVCTQIPLSKKALLQLTDDSLIDQNSLTLLQEAIAGATQFFGYNN